MATLTGQSIASSYEQLLHVDTDGGGNTTTLVPVKDGDNGTTFALQLSTTTAVIDNPTASSASQGGILRLQSDDGAVMASGHRLGVIEFGGAEDTSSTITTGARIEAVTDATWSASENGADMVFFTTDGDATQQEVMRLTADNAVAINKNDPSTAAILWAHTTSKTHIARFFNDGDDAAYGGLHVQCGKDDQSGTTIFYECDDGNGQGVGTLSNVSGTFQLTDASDVRLKENIVDTAINGLDTVNAIKVRDFDWKKSGITCSAGFIANELVEVFAPAVTGEPDAVKTNEDGENVIDPMSVSRDRLVPVLIKAVQELSAKVAVLENA